MGFNVVLLLLKLLINAVALIITAGMFKYIRIDGFGAAFIAAIVLALVNTFFKPFLVLLTLPINIMTFGLFMLLINALVLKLVSVMVSGFSVQGFWTALGGALVLSIVSGLLNVFLPTDRIFAM
ncbi:phage holin family protein [Candidatus Auribacterota bacterium]